MRYWVYDKKSKTVTGPHLLSGLASIPGFGPETKVAPMGSQSKKDWKAAKNFPELAELLKPKDPEDQPPPETPKK